MKYDINLRGNCILCAEDNEVNQMVLRHVLEEQPIPFLIVPNGKEAVDAWEALNPSIILMDISMPIMDGLEAMRIIRERELVLGTHVPIIALSAHALKGDEARFMAQGADHYMSKPLNTSFLLETVDRIISANAKKAAVF